MSGDIDRKLKTVSRSRFFWVYSLSLWDPDAFWKCLAGAASFAVVGLFLLTLTEGSSLVTLVNATAIFEYFLLGLILMWLYNLGPWAHPTNLKVIVRFIFSLYRRNKTVDELSAEDISRLFPDESTEKPSTLREYLNPWRIYTRLERSPVFGALASGAMLALILVVLLRITG